MSERTINEMWIMAQVEMSKVQDLLHSLAKHDNATYGGPFDFYRQCEQIDSQLRDNVHHAVSQTQYLRFRLEAFFEMKRKEKMENIAKVAPKLIQEPSNG